MVHQIAWYPLPDGHREPPSGVVLVGGDGDGLDCAIRDLVAAGVPYQAFEDPADIASPSVELGPTPVVLVLPRPDDAPEASVDLVLRALLRIHERGIEARLWVGTTDVYGGSNIGHAPLWGLARVAAVEHPQIWGGVLDVADGRFPLDVLGSLHGHGVIVMRDSVPHTARLASPGAVGPEPGPALKCSPGGTYLITGGTGVLGLQWRSGSPTLVRDDCCCCLVLACPTAQRGVTTPASSRSPPYRHSRTAGCRYTWRQSTSDRPKRRTSFAPC